MAENITKATEASVESYLSGIEDEADMPAGRARMAYWPEEGGGFHWVVESRTKKGWRRFVDHSYRADRPTSG